MIATKLDLKISNERVSLILCNFHSRHYTLKFEHFKKNYSFHNQSEPLTFRIKVGIGHICLVLGRYFIPWKYFGIKLSDVSDVKNINNTKQTNRKIDWIHLTLRFTGERDILNGFVSIFYKGA